MSLLPGFFILASGFILIFAYRIFREIAKANSDDPRAWEKDIQAFEAAARKHPPPTNATLFVGSSSIRFWRTLKKDMYPIPVIQRGFGGSRLAALAFYAERLIDVNDPKVIVVFSGTNDITPKHAEDPQRLLESFKAFVETARRKLPGTHIYYIAITPSPYRWQVWPIAQETNRLIQDYCEKEIGLDFIDTTKLWLGEDGRPDPANYLRIDRLHPNKRGYAKWTGVIRPLLLGHYPELEEQAELLRE